MATLWLVFSVGQEALAGRITVIQPGMSQIQVPATTWSSWVGPSAVHLNTSERELQMVLTDKRLCETFYAWISPDANKHSPFLPEQLAHLADHVADSNRIPSILLLPHNPWCLGELLEVQYRNFLNSIFKPFELVVVATPNVEPGRSVYRRFGMSAILRNNTPLIEVSSHETEFWKRVTCACKDSAPVSLVIAIDAVDDTNAWRREFDDPIFQIWMMIIAPCVAGIIALIGAIYLCDRVSDRIQLKQEELQVWRDQQDKDLKAKLRKSSRKYQATKLLPPKTEGWIASVVVCMSEDPQNQVVCIDAFAQILLSWGLARGLLGLHSNIKTFGNSRLFLLLPVSSTAAAVLSYWAWSRHAHPVVATSDKSGQPVLKDSSGSNANHGSKRIQAEDLVLTCFAAMVVEWNIMLLTVYYYTTALVILVACSVCIIHLWLLYVIVFGQNRCQRSGQFNLPSLESLVSFRARPRIHDKILPEDQSKSAAQWDSRFLAGLLLITAANFFTLIYASTVWTLGRITPLSPPTWRRTALMCCWLRILASALRIAAAIALLPRGTRFGNFVAVWKQLLVSIDWAGAPSQTSLQPVRKRLFPGVDKVRRLGIRAHNAVSARVWGGQTTAHQSSNGPVSGRTNTEPQAPCTSAEGGTEDSLSSKTLSKPKQAASSSTLANGAAAVTAAKPTLDFRHPRHTPSKYGEQRERALDRSVWKTSLRRLWAGFSSAVSSRGSQVPTEAHGQVNNVKQAFVKSASVEEYGERMKNLRQAMYQEGHDLLWLMDPEWLQYCSGYADVLETRYMPPALAVLVSSASTQAPLAFDMAQNKDRWATTTCAASGAWVFSDYHGPSTLHHDIGAIKTTFEDRRWMESLGHKPVLAIACGGTTMVRPQVLLALQQAFEQWGITVVVSPSCYDLIRQVKTRREVDSLRVAADLLIHGVSAVRDRIDINHTELDLYATGVHKMVSLGGGVPWRRPGTILVSPTGEHKVPSRNWIRPGDLILVNMSGVHDEERVNCTRAFYLQHFPHPFNTAPSELHQAFQIAGGLFHSLDRIKFKDSKRSVKSLCKRIARYFHDSQCHRSSSQNTNRGLLTWQCQLLVGTNAHILADVEEELDRWRSLRNATGGFKRSGRLQNSMILQVDTILDVKSTVHCSLKDSGARISATLSETILVGELGIELLGPSPRRLVEISPLSSLWR